MRDTTLVRLRHVAPDDGIAGDGGGGGLVAGGRILGLDDGSVCSTGQAKVSRNMF